MTVTELVDHLESGQKVRWKNFKDLRGLGQEYFTRLIGYYGSDNTQLEKLGRHWKKVVEHAPDLEWGFRAGGIYERLHGRWRQSADAFVLAGRIADDSVAQFAFQIGAIDSLGRAGDIRGAERLANRLNRELLKLDEPGMAARALFNLGNVLIYREEMRSARRVLNRVLPALESAGFQVEAISARVGLSSTQLFGGNPWEAEALAIEARDAAKALDLDYLADLAELNIAIAFTLTNRSEEAFQRLTELRSRFEDSEIELARTDEYLADAMLNLNLWDEASAQYSDVLKSGQQSVPLHLANLHYGLGCASANLGQLTEAKGSLSTAKRLYVRIENLIWAGLCELRMAELEQVGALRARRLELARELGEGSPYVLARINLLAAESNLELLPIAKRAIVRYGYLDIKWKVDYLQAKNAANPLPHYRRMMRWILVDRLQRGSVAGSVAFFRDKDQAISEYLGLLVQRGTKSSVREARGVIEQIRAVTLLDEIGQSGGGGASGIVKIAAIAEELRSFGSKPSNRNSRFAGGAVSFSSIQRRANEALLNEPLVHQPSLSGGETSLVLWEGNGSFAVLGRERVQILPGAADELRKLDRWLKYELACAAPDSQAHPRQSEKLLKDISDLFRSVLTSEIPRICPDGAAWSVPWAACSALRGDHKAWQVALHPSLSGAAKVHFGSLLVLAGDSENLAHTEEEIEEVSRHFVNVVVARSRKQALEVMQSRYDCVHVVSHAMHRPLNPMVSAIKFEDGSLFAFEIARSGLRAELATLSACEMGAISAQSHTEPDGLARAFLACGAKSVVAPLWELNDLAGKVFFTALYEQCWQKKALFESFLQAQCICRDHLAHPFYWAPFTLYSGTET